jgi:hypothetical protein
MLEKYGSHGNLLTRLSSFKGVNLAHLYDEENLEIQIKHDNMYRSTDGYLSNKLSDLLGLLIKIS